MFYDALHYYLKMSYAMLRASVHFVFRHILTSEFFDKKVKHTQTVRR